MNIINAWCLKQTFKNFYYLPFTPYHFSYKGTTVMWCKRSHLPLPCFNVSHSRADGKSKQNCDTLTHLQYLRHTHIRSWRSDVKTHVRSQTRARRGNISCRAPSEQWAELTVQGHQDPYRGLESSCFHPENLKLRLLYVYSIQCYDMITREYEVKTHEHTRM